jgi:hypothetical protein
MNSDSAPHNFIISFNTEKIATRTGENLLGEQKEGDLRPSFLLVRNGRDSNPRPPA